MYCLNCKYYEYQDYRLNEEGTEEPFGTCFNHKSEELNEEVPEYYFCDEFTEKTK